MDRERKQKVIKYLGRYAAFAIIFSVFMYASAAYENYVEQQKMLALLARHPELEAEVISLWKKPENYMEIWPDAAARMVEEKYGYQLDGSEPKKAFWIFWGAGLLAGIFFTGVSGYFEWHKQKKVKASGEELQELFECLERFREGDFRRIPSREEPDAEWMKLWETVRELGAYFEGLEERLSAEEESTKALITDISHQLKTPLASLRMSYELAAEDSLTEEERKEFQEQEAKEIEKLEMLLGELVNLSRLETHMIQIRPVYASLKDTLTEAVSQIYMKARSKGIEIQVDMAGDMEIHHDPKWTNEAFANVLDNAVKYSANNTVISVRVQPLIKNVLIEVEDEGIGLLPEEFVKIYQRFYRGREAKEKVKEGAGIGLYLTRMILERQGGTISAKSKAGRGTIFRITLPC